MKGIKLFTFATLLFFTSGVIHSEFHQHKESETKTSCSICVFASNLASGDGQSVHKIIVEQKTFLFIPLIYDIFFIPFITPQINSTRGPPFISF